MKHIDKELKNISPELKKVGRSFVFFLVICTWIWKYEAQSTYTNLQERIAALSSTVNAAEDEAFVPFCRKIGVATVREYEEQ